MKAEELRMGNYVYWGNLILEGVNSSEIYQFDTMRIKLEPIPLTEHWLIDKFGFEKVESDNPKIHPFADYVKDNVVIGLPYFEFSFCDGEETIEVKHVHTLQNLFFAVKQRELEVKS